MKAFRRLCILSCLVGLLAACTPLSRGFSNGRLVSSSHPSLELALKLAPAGAAESLPLRESGRMEPLVYTANGYASPEVHLAVYGTGGDAPVAIVALARVPDGWEWDPLSFSYADGPLSAQMELNGQKFEGSLHVVDSAEDPFGALFGEADGPQQRWLAARWAALLDFRQAKVILDYREPLPASLETLPSGAEVPPWNPAVRDFQARSQEMFSLASPGEGERVSSAPWIGSLSKKKIGSWLGSFARKEPLWELDN